MATWTYLMPVSGNNATMELLSSHTRPRARLGALSLHFQVFYVFVFETNETSLFHCQKTYKATGMVHFVSSSVLQLGPTYAHHRCKLMVLRGSSIE